jgi:23S rRNA pseudouridine1911/1915/1917 synthase
MASTTDCNHNWGHLMNAHGLDGIGAYVKQVNHHIVSETNYPRLDVAICQELQRENYSIESGYLEELADIGAIYVAPSRETTAKRTRITSRDALDTPTPVDTYIKIHRFPLRRRLALEVNWSERIIKTNDNDIVVINKPAGVPIHASVDNFRENVQWQLQECFKMPIIVTGRLDVCTSGVIILGKSKSAASMINRYLRERKILKTYRLLTTKSVPLGILRHLHRHVKGSKPSLLRPYIEKKHKNDTDMIQVNENGNRNKRDRSIGEEWKEASLEILSCEKIDSKLVTSDAIAMSKTGMITGNHIETGANNDGTDNCDYYEVKVQLHTGRTHQIRLQMTALGAPIVGDTYYESVSGLMYDDLTKIGSASEVQFGIQPDRIALHCEKLEIPDWNNKNGLVLECQDTWWINNNNQ